MASSRRASLNTPPSCARRGWWRGCSGSSSLPGCDGNAGITLIISGNIIASERELFSSLQESCTCTTWRPRREYCTVVVWPAVWSRLYKQLDSYYVLNTTAPPPPGSLLAAPSRSSAAGVSYPWCRSGAARRSYPGRHPPPTSLESSTGPGHRCPVMIDARASMTGPHPSRWRSRAVRGRAGTASAAPTQQSPAVRGTLFSQGHLQ